MSAVAPSLTLADAARMMNDAVRDRTYVDDTGLGRDVDRFLTYFTTERGKSQAGRDTYEYTLARLAVRYAFLSLDGFEGRDGTNLIRDFLRDTYADVTAGTWNGRVAHVKAFFRWAFEEGRIDTNPAAMIRYRTLPESERSAHSPEQIARIVVAQTERRDRIAVQLLGRMALRRNELRIVQFRHVNRDTRTLTIFGKGGTVRALPLFDDLFEQIQREALERLARPEEFLLYPTKLGRVGRFPDERMGVIWEDRLRALSLSGIDKWWLRLLDRAGAERFPMHELRHSAGTEFWRRTHDLKMTQRFMRHKDIRTTADTYVHDRHDDLVEAYDALPRWEVE